VTLNTKEVSLTPNQDVVNDTAMAVTPVTPKTARSGVLKIGDRVEVTKGFFVGATGTIVAKMGLKFYVESPKWVQGNEFLTSELKVIR
jgi:hydrogenase maturation factor